LIRNSETGAQLAGGLVVDSAAAVPLRAHGVVVGSLVVADARGGALAPDDVRLLSTVATHAAVALANGRFFDLVRRGKEQWETTFDALSEGLAVVDDDGRVRRANRSLAAMLGQPLPAVIGEILASALLGRAEALDELLAAVRHDDRPAPLVERAHQPQGRTFRVNAARMPGGDPNQAAVVLVQDVTEQQAMEAQLIQSEKLATVGQLVSGVAHELNNPLTSISGLAEFLLEQKELGPGDRGHLKVIHEQAERAGRIVRNLLTFARKGPTERSRLDLNDLVQRTLLLVSYDLRLRDVETQTELPDDLPEVIGDRHALQQVVLNLLTNAAQAVGGLGEDRVRCIRIETWHDTQVHLRVSDTGPGVPEDLVRQLFTPFFTTKEPGHGTGLGLSISYSIVESHGGHFSYERSPEGGASFRIDLPLAPATRPAAPAPESPVPQLPPSFAKRAILLVDDDPAVRRLVQALFGREGHAVDVARNAEHALALASDRPYDLILADGQVSAQGKLFVEELMARHPALKTRTLVATGDVRPSTEEALDRLGLRYVRKPFNLRDLREEAARLWAAATLS
jgi:two-component system NtrC family sensor kinase